MADNIATRTIRPDKIDEIKDAINDAIEFCTVNGDFANDLVESIVAVGMMYIVKVSLLVRHL